MSIVQKKNILPSNIMSAKMFVIYKNLSNQYESFVERFSLRERKKDPHMSKADIVKKAIHFWKEENLSKNHGKLEQYVTLREGEKPFVR